MCMFRDYIKEDYSSSHYFKNTIVGIQGKLCRYLCVHLYTLHLYKCGC